MPPSLCAKHNTVNGEVECPQWVGNGHQPEKVASGRSGHRYVELRMGGRSPPAHLTKIGVCVPKGILMHKTFLAILLLGTAAAPAISIAAQRPTHQTSSGQHQSSQRHSGSAGTSQHVRHAPSSQHAKPTAPGGTSRQVTHAPSPQHAKPIAPGGTSRHVTHAPSSQQSRPTVTGGTSQRRHPPAISSTPRFGSGWATSWA
jgi:hypothetical protein